jgi:hypothetical protein
MMTATTTATVNNNEIIKPLGIRHTNPALAQINYAAFFFPAEVRAISTLRMVDPNLRRRPVQILQVAPRAAPKPQQQQQQQWTLPPPEPEAVLYPLDKSPPLRVSRQVWYGNFILTDEDDEEVNELKCEEEEELAAPAKKNKTFRLTQEGVDHRAPNIRHMGQNPNTILHFMRTAAPEPQQQLILDEYKWKARKHSRTEQLFYYPSLISKQQQEEEEPLFKRQFRSSDQLSALQRVMFNQASAPFTYSMSSAYTESFRPVSMAR